METPSVWIKTATFSDGTTIEFSPSDFVVFVGPNNAGKSEALKNIKEKSRRSDIFGLVIKELIVEIAGDQDALMVWIENNCRKKSDHNGETFSLLTNKIHKSHISRSWNNKLGLIELADFFVHYITTERRLGVSDPANSIDLINGIYQHPIHHMQANDNIEFEMSSYFQRAFGQDLVVYRNAGNKVPLLVGERPVPKEGQDRVSFDYLEELAKLSPLQTQGDGMRAFVGVLLYALIMRFSVTLIDEPDAFLHPPQARFLGRMLIEKSPTNKQMFVSTHSSDFIKGLLESKNSRVRIIRLQREGDINVTSELDSEGVKNVWGDPILRYSNVLDGLFHEEVIVCEGDADCRFYSAVYDSISNTEGNGIQSLLFLNCGGKARMPVVIESLRKLGVPIKVITDFDILNDRVTLKKIVDGLGGEWNEVSSDLDNVKKAIDKGKPELSALEVKNEIEKTLSNISGSRFPLEAGREIKKTLRKSSLWSLVKSSGKTFVPSGNPTAMCNKLLEKLKVWGLFVVEVGELESFVRSIGNHGPRWVNKVLEEKDLRNDPELEDARNFIRNVVNQD